MENQFDNHNLLLKLEGEKVQMLKQIDIAKQELEVKTKALLELYDELQKTQFKINGLTIL